MPFGKIFAAVVLFCSLSGFAQTRICFGTFLNENFAEASVRFSQISNRDGSVFSFGPYIVAVGSTRLENALFDYNEILKLALDLQIWEIEYENQ